MVFTMAANVNKMPEPAMQYRFQSKVEESCSPDAIFQAVLDMPITFPLCHLAAVCPDVRRQVVDNFKTSKGATPAPTLLSEAVEGVSVIQNITIPYHRSP